MFFSLTFLCASSQYLISVPPVQITSQILIQRRHRIKGHDLDIGQATFTLVSRDVYFGVLKNLQSKGEMMEKSSRMEVWGSHSGLYNICLALYFNQNSLSYGLPNRHCTSALTIFKNCIYQIAQIRINVHLEDRDKCPHFLHS